MKPNAQTSVSFQRLWGYLVGEGVNVSFDKKNLKRLQDIDKLNEKDKELVFEFLDSFISNRKIKKALS